jgi:hypothetical protein
MNDTTFTDNRLCLECRFELGAGDDPFDLCKTCGKPVCDDCDLKHQVQVHNTPHQHDYGMTDCDSEMDRVRYTCNLCGTEYMITYEEYARANGNPINEG